MTSINRASLSLAAYVVLMIIIISLAGVSLEPLMMVGVIQRYPAYIKIWFVMTIFTLTASVVMAMSFLLQVKKSLQVKFNKLCSLEGLHSTEVAYLLLTHQP